MDLTGGLGRLGALRDRPRAHLGLSGGQIGDQSQQAVAGVDQAIQTGLGKAHVREKQLLFLRLKPGDLRFNLRGNRQHTGMLLVRYLLHRLEIRIVLHAVLEIGLRHVRRINDRLVRQQRDSGEQLCLLRRALHTARRFARVEGLAHALEEVQLRLVFLVGLEHLLRLVDAAVEDLHIRKDQLEVDRLDVAGRVDAALDMHDIVVHKAAHDMHNRIHLADVRKELVAKPLSLGRAAHQPGDIHKLNRRGRVLLRVVHLSQLVQTLVRHSHDADIRLDGAERIVCRLRPRVCDGVEQRAFAHVGQTDDT